MLTVDDDGGAEISHYVVEKQDAATGRWTQCGESPTTHFKVYCNAVIFEALLISHVISPVRKGERSLRNEVCFKLFLPWYTVDRSIR